MGIVKSGFSAIGKLILVLSLTATFFVGLFGVVYIQLKGEEISIPKVVGKNFNVGKDDLSEYGLRIKKIATRYSNEEPNTILEQRPRAGTTAKSGLMISVVVSEKNPDGSELPVEVKDDEEAIDEIEQQPELKIDKPKNRSKSKKTTPKNRDVIKEKTDEEKAEAKQDVAGEQDSVIPKPPVKKNETKKIEMKPPPKLKKEVTKPAPKPIVKTNTPKTSG